MKIALITDAHANLPALEAALDAIQAEGCDAVYHLGDAVAIGPHPAECVDLLLNTPNLVCTLGNHELYYLRGIPDPQPAWMSAGEVQHQRWTHAQLGAGRRAALEVWPLKLEMVLEGVKIALLHYGLDQTGTDFIAVTRDPSAADLERVFDRVEADLVFFGHDHAPSDRAGVARYINPGSLGCSPEAVARYTSVTLLDGQVEILHHAVPYDDTDLFAAFEDRDVPEREFIYKVFMGGRFGN